MDLMKNPSAPVEGKVVYKHKAMKFLPIYVALFFRWRCTELPSSYLTDQLLQILPDYSWIHLHIFQNQNKEMIFIQWNIFLWGCYLNAIYLFYRNIFNLIWLYKENIFSHIAILLLIECDIYFKTIYKWKIMELLNKTNIYQCTESLIITHFQGNQTGTWASFNFSLRTNLIKFKTPRNKLFFGVFVKRVFYLGCVTIFL